MAVWFQARRTKRLKFGIASLTSLSLSIQCITTLRESAKPFVSRLVRLKEGSLVRYLNDGSFEIWSIEDHEGSGKIKMLRRSKENLQDNPTADINTDCIALENNCLASTTKEGNIQLWFVEDIATHP